MIVVPLSIILGLVLAYCVLQDGAVVDWSGRWIGPRGWALLVLLVWPIGAPLYLLRRPSKRRSPRP